MQFVLCLGLCSDASVCIIVLQDKALISIVAGGTSRRQCCPVCLATGDKTRVSSRL